MEQEQSPTSNPNPNPLFLKLQDYGFQESHINKALLLTTQEDQAVELIMTFIEDDENPPKVSQQQFTHMVTQLVQQDSQNEHEQQEQVKMVIVVRKDLKMKTGKIAAQVGHAVLGAYKQIIANKNPRQLQLLSQWEEIGQKKIVTSIPGNEDILLALAEKANNMGVNVCTIRDAGHTQVDPNSLTVAAFGPDLDSQLEQLTGGLKLL